MVRRTIAHVVESEGVALHAGTNVHMSLAPAPAGYGVAFVRRDLGGGPVKASYENVADTKLGTVIANGAVRIGVVEHLMAAIAGAEIDDLQVTLDGPEPPILDGDALGYLRLLEMAGIREDRAPSDAIVVRKSTAVGRDDAWARLEPSEIRHFDFDIRFDSSAIGAQHLSWDFSSSAFKSDIAPARTFGFMSELEMLNKMGLGKGASLENTLAIDGDRVINRDLMRFPDEFVRHKILDAIGDLALAGAPIIGRFVGFRSGHALNNALLRALFADPSNWERRPRG